MKSASLVLREPNGAGLIALLFGSRVRCERVNGREPGYD